MLTVHHLNKSRSQRVLWLLEELGVTYEIVTYQRDPKTDLAPPELAQIHPLGKSPVVTDDGETIAESAAILEYLIETYGQGRFVPAPGTPAYRRYRYFMHYAEGSLAPFLVLKLITSKMRKLPFPVRPVGKLIAGKLDAIYVDPNLARHVAFLERELDGRPFLCGDELTVADIQMSYPMEMILERIPDPPARIVAYVERIRARPAYTHARERGG